MSARTEKNMMMLKHAIEFDCAGSDGLLPVHDEPLRRKAFSIRRQNGKPRALVLSLFVHVSIGAALFFQLVPQQFMRMPGGGNEQQPLEVFLMAEPAGAARRRSSNRCRQLYPHLLPCSRCRLLSLS